VTLLFADSLDTSSVKKPNQIVLRKVRLVREGEGIWLPLSTMHYLILKLNLGVSSTMCYVDSAADFAIVETTLREKFPNVQLKDLPDVFVVTTTSSTTFGN